MHLYTCPPEYQMKGCIFSGGGLCTIARMNVEAHGGNKCVWDVQKIASHLVQSELGTCSMIWILLQTMGHNMHKSKSWHCDGPCLHVIYQWQYHLWQDWYYNGHDQANQHICVLSLTYVTADKTIERMQLEVRNDFFLTCFVAITSPEEASLSLANSAWKGSLEEESGSVCVLQNHIGRQV